jgi:hypothetical protein
VSPQAVARPGLVVVDVAKTMANDQIIDQKAEESPVGVSVEVDEGGIEAERALGIGHVSVSYTVCY